MVMKSVTGREELWLKKKKRTVLDVWAVFFFIVFFKTIFGTIPATHA